MKDKINEFKTKIAEEKINYNKKVHPLKKELRGLRNKKFKPSIGKFRRSQKDYTKNCRTFRGGHIKIFLTLDLLMILIIFCNFGALLITNVLVIKTNPETELMEGNPVTAEMYDYETTPELNKKFLMMVSFLSIWALLTFFYVLFRNHICSEEFLYLLIFFVIFYFIILTSDFINNLGYYIGRKLW